MTNQPNILPANRDALIDQFDENRAVVREQVKRIIKHKNESTREITKIVIAHLIDDFGNITVDAYDSEYWYDTIAPAIEKRDDMATCFEAMFFEIGNPRVDYVDVWRKVKEWYSIDKDTTMN